MNCHSCGGKLKKIVTDLPFKLRNDSIVIIKNLPVFQCQNCHEYLLEDQVLEQVDKILEKVGNTVELEILNYAA